MTEGVVLICPLREVFELGVPPFSSLFCSLFSSLPSIFPLRCNTSSFNRIMGINRLSPTMLQQGYELTIPLPTNGCGLNTDMPDVLPNWSAIALHDVLF